MTLIPDADKEEEFALALMKRLPATVRVGAHDFHILLLGPNAVIAEGKNGLFSSSCQTIEIGTTLPTRYAVVDVVLHELAHAIFWTGGLEDKDDEERTVERFGGGLTGLFRDNPWLLDWIKSAEL